MKQEKTILVRKEVLLLSNKAKRMYNKSIRAQSALEYVIVLTALIVCILWAANTLFKPAVEQGLTDAQSAIEKVAEDINN